MSEEGENIEPTPMDQVVDGFIKKEQPPEERYRNLGEDSQLVADKFERLPKDENKPTSLLMADVERTLALTTLKSPSVKFDAFVSDINRKQPFKLKTFSNVIGRDIRRQFRTEINTGAKPAKLRTFDIQSQAMRMITANMAIGSHQFQRAVMLPYMRKNLALGYQKVSLLKDIVKGIGSMELAVVSKLEAIKLNTAAVVPRKKSFFQKLKDEIEKRKIERISSNFADLELSGYSSMYRKFVLPLIGKIDDQAQNKTKGGGVNGIRRMLMRNVNSARRKVRDYTVREGASDTKLEKIKTLGAKTASRVLGTTVALGNKVKLGEKINKLAGSAIAWKTGEYRNFDPFQSNNPFIDAPQTEPGATARDRLLEDEEGIRTTGTSPISRILEEWREEWRKSQETSNNHLKEINDQLKTTRFGRRRGPGDDDGGAAPVVDHPVPPPSGPPSSGGSLSGKIRLQPKEFNPLTPRSVKVTPNLPPLPQREEVKEEAPAPLDLTPKGPSKFGETLRRARATSQVKSAELAEFGKRLLSPLSGLNLFPKVAAAAVAGPDIGAAIQPLMDIARDSLPGASTPDKPFFRRMFENLNKKVEQVTETVDTGNKERSKFETLQSKWKAMADKLKAKVIRKNSYEDIQQEKEKAKAEKNGKLAAIMDKARGIAGNLKSGNVAGAAVTAGGGVLDWLKDQFEEEVTDKAVDKAGGGIKKGIGKLSTKLSGGKTKGLRGFLGRMGTKLAGEGAEELAETTVNQGKKGIARKAASLLWRGTKGTAKLGAKAGWGLGKLSLKGLSGAAGLAAPGLLKGGLGLAKGVGPGLLVGLGATAAKGYIDTHATGNLQRLGDTAADMASWGATGATIGSVIPGLGTLAGGAIGAAAGAIAANSDVIGAGLKDIGNRAIEGIANGFIGTVKGFQWMNTALFGKEAEVDEMGRVKRKGQSTLIGSMWSSIFGRDAKYAKSGEVIQDGKTGLISDVKKNFDVFLFGKKDKAGNYIEGSALLTQMGQGIIQVHKDFITKIGEIGSSMLEGFKTFMGNIGGGISSGLSWAGDKLSSFGGAVSQGLSSAVNKAMEMVGLEEHQNKGQIQNYLSAGGANNVVDPAVTAWCAAFVNATLAKAGIRGTGNLTASSFKTWGVPINPNQVQQGDVLIENKGAMPGQPGDHVGIATGNTRPGPGGTLSIEMLAGNSGGRVAKVFYPADRLVIRRAKEQAVGANGVPPGLSVTNNPWAQQAQNPVGPLMSGYVPATNPTGSFAPGFGNAPGFSVSSAAGGYSGFGQLPPTAVAKGAADRFNQVVNYLVTRKGWSRTAALGIAATLYGESQLRPDAVNPNDRGKVSKGLPMWRDTRITDIERRAGKPIESMSLTEQLDAIDWELRSGSGISKSNYIPNGSAPMVQALNGATSFEEAVQQMVYRYERPANAAMQVQRRVQEAYSIMGSMANARPTPVSVPQNGGNGFNTGQKPATTASQAAPKRQAPAPQQQPGWVGTFADSVANFGDTVKAMTAPATPAANKSGNNTTVFAPVFHGGGGNNNNNDSFATMSMKKKSVRTGL